VFARQFLNLAENLAVTIEVNNLAERETSENDDNWETRSDFQFVFPLT